MEINRLLLGNGSNKRRATGEPKALREFRLVKHEEEKKSEELTLLKVWKILTPEARIAMRYGEEVKIGIVKDGGTKEIKHRGGKMYPHQKKDRTKFLRLTQSERKKNMLHT